jgi:hypothetical protein
MLGAGVRSKGRGVREARRNTRKIRSELSAEITSVLKPFRVQDARAALPQNCSLKKLTARTLSAYGTSVPYSPAKVLSIYLTEDRALV